MIFFPYQVLALLCFETECDLPPSPSLPDSLEVEHVVWAVCFLLFQLH